jgi:hypothetical protein
MFSNRTIILFILAVMLLGFNIYHFFNVNLAYPMADMPAVNVGNPDYPYEEGLIQYVSNGTVQVQTYDTKIIYLFVPRAQDMSRFSKGSIAALSFRCDDPQPKCDPAKPDKLYANSVPVELLLVKL